MDIDLETENANKPKANAKSKTNKKNRTVKIEPRKTNTILNRERSRALKIIKSNLNLKDSDAKYAEQTLYSESSTLKYPLKLYRLKLVTIASGLDSSIGNALDSSDAIMETCDPVDFKVAESTSHRCSNCESTNIRFKTEQRRRADEAPTILYECVNCGKRWSQS